MHRSYTGGDVPDQGVHQADRRHHQFTLGRQTECWNGQPIESPDQTQNKNGWRIPRWVVYLDVRLTEVYARLTLGTKDVLEHATFGGQLTK